MAIAGDPLLRSVLEQPGDTELRLVHADWLEERGELDRATLIRAQCALHEVPSYDYRWIEHGNWCAEHRAAVTPPSLPHGLEWEAFPYRRGFPERLRIYDGDAFLAHAPALFAQAPVCSLEVDVRRTTFPLDRLLATPWLLRITRLHFHLGRFGADAIHRLAGSPHLENIAELGFGFEGITGDGLRALLRSTLAQRLTTLGLRSNFFLEYGRSLDAFRDAPALPRLKHLDLTGNRIGADVVRAITHDSRLALDELTLFDNPLGTDGWRAVAEAPLQLRHLDLGKTHPQLPAVRALATSPHTATLRFLKLDHDRLGPGAATALAAARWPELEFLDASGNELGNRGMTALMTSPGFPKLRRADIGGRGNIVGRDPSLVRRASAWFESTERMRAAE